MLKRIFHSRFEVSFLIKEMLIEFHQEGWLRIKTSHELFPKISLILSLICLNNCQSLSGLPNSKSSHLTRSVFSPSKIYKVFY